MAANPQAALDSAVPETLADRLAEGALPHAEAVRIAIGLAESLREIHHQGRVYGLLQPGGIAIIEGQVRLLPSNSAALTAYFSPEQVAGNDLDPRSDIFSLGAVMYEMFSGRKAFRALSRTALRMEIQNRDSAVLDDVPPALARLIHRCLDKKPERRIQRMEILLAELKLQSALAGRHANGNAVPLPAVRKAPPVVVTGQPTEPDTAVPAQAREKLPLACPLCGARDVHSSRPHGPFEAALTSAGVRIGRCYRCYHRFFRLAGFTFKRQ